MHRRWHADDNMIEVSVDVLAGDVYGIRSRVWVSSARSYRA